jgi:hypothetical protein
MRAEYTSLWQVVRAACLAAALLAAPAQAAFGRPGRQAQWLNASQNPVPAGGSTVLTAEVWDPDGDPVTVYWSASDGTLSSSTGLQVTLTVPDTSPGTVTVTATADDGQGGTATASMTLLVVSNNVAPFIELNADPLVVRNGRTTVLTAFTQDPNGEAVRVTWTTTAGTLSAGEGHQVVLTAPLTGREVTVTATAHDARGLTTQASLTLLLLPRNLPPTVRLNANPLVIRAPTPR